MKGRIVVIAIASIINYLLLVGVFFFSMPFMVSWGNKNPWYLDVISFLQDTPFNLIREDGEMAMSLVFVNALFWTACVALLLWFITGKSFKREPNI